MRCLTKNCKWNDGKRNCTLSFIEVYGTPNNPKTCDERTVDYNLKSD